jgi:hypothetical protein
MGKSIWPPQQIDPATLEAWTQAITSLDVKAAEALIKQRKVSPNQFIREPARPGAAPGAQMPALQYLLSGRDRGQEQAAMVLMLLKNDVSVNQYDGLGLRASDYALRCKNVRAASYVIAVTVLAESLGAFPLRDEYPLNRIFSAIGTQTERRAVLNNVAKIHADVRLLVSNMDARFRDGIAASHAFWIAPYQAPRLEDLPSPGGKTMDLANEFARAAMEQRARLNDAEFEEWQNLKDIEIYDSIRADIRRGRNHYRPGP